MVGAQTEAVLNKLSKSDLVQLILNTEANVVSYIAKLTTEVKDLLANSKKLEVVATEHQCWKNAQYSRKNALEVAGIPMSVRDSALELKVCDVIQETGMDICDWDIQACHPSER